MKKYIDNDKIFITEFIRRFGKILKNISMMLIAVCMVTSMTYVISADENEENDENTHVAVGRTWEEIKDYYFREYVEYICTEQEENEILFDTDRELNVVFVGNSRFGEPKVDKYFKELSQRYHLNVNVIRDIQYGKSIGYRLSVIDSEDYDFLKDDYASADVIIFHEYAWDYATTYEDICTILDKYCKKDVVAYYYTLRDDYELSSYLKEDPTAAEHIAYPLKKISDDERIHVIDYGRIFDTFYHMNSSHDYLYKPDGAHPNELSGLMAAGYIYTQMYKTVFTDYQYTELDDVIKSALPGSNDEEKEKFYNKMIDVLNKGVTDRDYSNIPMYVGSQIEKDNNQNSENKNSDKAENENNENKNNESRDNELSNHQEQNAIDNEQNISDTQQKPLNDQQKAETKINANDAAEGKTNEKSKAAPKTGDRGDTTALILFAIAGIITIVAKLQKGRIIY